LCSFSRGNEKPEEGKICSGSPELDEPHAWHIGQLRFCQG